VLQGPLKGLGGVGADEVKANDAGPMEDLSHQFPCDAATAVLHRYHELGEVSRQAVAQRMRETNDLAVGVQRHDGDRPGRQQHAEGPVWIGRKGRPPFSSAQTQNPIEMRCFEDRHGRP